VELKFPKEFSMIVMKFGGASMASPASIRQVAGLVRSHQHRHPVVVVSALGDTTDELVHILECAGRAESYCAWKAQENLKNYYFSVAEDLLGGKALDEVHSHLRSAFRDLHIRTLELCEGERSLTPELRDWVLSIGEQLSSRMMAAVLEEGGIPATYQDARQLILTDDHFTNAQPRIWETYARIRWSLPLAARDHVVVLGGFIGATEDGRTTTLGRGGSDLTASLVGAAVNAEEIQVWKDVDGLLTWDPRIKTGAHRVKRLSYEEAAELAWAGATILHPNTMAPAQRLRIPIVIRNTFRPQGEGTTVGICHNGSSGVVKSIACQTDVTLLEFQSLNNGVGCTKLSEQLDQLCKRRHIAGTLLGVSENKLYLALQSQASLPDPAFDLEGCVEVHLQSHQTVLTLVGQEICQPGLAKRLQTLLAPQSAVLLPGAQGAGRLRVVIPHSALDACLELLRRACFADLNPQCFDVSGPAAQKEPLPAAQLSQLPARPSRHLYLSPRLLTGS
jgi:aspartate kinase